MPRPRPRFDVVPTRTNDLPFGQFVVIGESSTPGCVAEGREVSGRPDDVGEQHCPQPALRSRGTRAFADERFDLGQDGPHVAEPRDPIITRQLHEPCVGHLRSDGTSRL